MSQNTPVEKSIKSRKIPRRLSVAEKKAIVLQLEAGIMYKTISEQYGLAHSTLQEWVNKYASEAFLSTKKKDYDLSFISPVVRAILEGRLTNKDAAIQYRVHPNTVKGWIKRYQHHQAMALPPVPVPTVQAGETATERRLREELEAAQWKLRALETMIDVAEAELKIPIRKKPGGKQ